MTKLLVKKVDCGHWIIADCRTVVVESDSLVSEDSVIAMVAITPLFHCADFSDTLLILNARTKKEIKLVLNSKYGKSDTFAY